MRMRIILLLALAAIATGASGCFSPNYTDRSLQCSPAGDCPRGYMCVDGRCYSGTPPAPDMSEGPDMAPNFSLPICKLGSNNYGDACRFGP